MINSFLRILFHDSCPVCKKSTMEHGTAPICPDCWQTIQPHNTPICQRCGKPLASDISLTCGVCLKDEPAFKYARSFGPYEGVLKKAINLLKYYRIKRLSKPLSNLILLINSQHADVIIPVPLYKKRIRQREFNQSALLAKHIAKRQGIKIILDCLIKIRDTIPQVGLSAKERKKNIRKAFEIRNKEPIKGKNIMLVDDVITTGATVRECSKLLKKAGAGDIYVITLAHGTLD